jgi:flagellar hook protein FlgE
MLQAMFAGVSGLQSQQTKMNIIGNNIANLNTVGFKTQVVTFQDQLSQTLKSASGPSDSSGGTNPTQVGLGVAVGSENTINTHP